MKTRVGMLLRCSTSNCCNEWISNNGIHYDCQGGAVEDVSLEEVARRYSMSADIAHNLSPRCRETVKGRDELGHLYHLHFIAVAGSCCPNGICAEMVWFTGSRAMTTRTRAATLAATSVFSPPSGGEAVGSTCTTRLKAGGSQKEQVLAAQKT